MVAVVMLRSRLNFRTVLLALGCGLLGLNLFGGFRTMRAADVQALRFHSNDVTLSHGELLAQLPRRPGEAESAYILRMTGVVNRGMAHYWGEELDKYNLRVPIWENYLLYLGSLIRPDIYRKYEFAREDKAMERGVGLCSQQAIVLARLLQRAGISAELQGLRGHVVVRATERSGRVYMADPDYGVVIPAPIAAIERDIGLVRPYYRQVGLDPASVDRMAAIYGREGNAEMTIGQYLVPKVYYAETAAYVLKWLFPLLLTIPFLIDVIRHRNARR